MCPPVLPRDTCHVGGTPAGPGAGPYHARFYSTRSPSAPVRMSTASVTSVTKILPSPGRPVWALARIVCTIAGHAHLTSVTTSVPSRMSLRISTR